LEAQKNHHFIRTTEKSYNAASFTFYPILILQELRSFVDSVAYCSGISDYFRTHYQQKNDFF